MPSQLPAAASLLLLVLSTMGLFGCGSDAQRPADRGNEPDCSAAETRCEGLHPQTCTADGTWLAAAAEPCPFVCSHGACTGACRPGSRQCDGLAPQVCDTDGSWVPQNECAYACYAGGCTGVCVPGSEQCDGLVPQVCDANGSWVARDACAFGCFAGGCTGVCAPGDRQCDGLFPQTCDSAGAWLSERPCDFLCVEANCAGECVPGSGQCDGLIPRTCDTTGTWVVADTCEFICGEGRCVGVCAPGDQRCHGAATLEICDATGSWIASACSHFCSAETTACGCNPGYVPDGTNCTPIDFCIAPNGGCSPRATCSQADATPTCTCNDGFEGDGYSCSATTVRLNEGFDNINTLDWWLVNKSSPRGTTDWFQGIPLGGDKFDSFDGAPDAYIAADYDNVYYYGTLSNWLVTPEIDFGVQTSFSFQTRGLDYSTGVKAHADRIEVRVCSQVPCALPHGNNMFGGFSVLLGSVNPTLISDGYPSAWTLFEYTTELGIPRSGRGRIAIHYYVAAAGASGPNGDYIGIDRAVLRVGEPAYEVAGSISGLTTGTVALRLNGSELLQVDSDGAFAFTRILDSGTTYSVSVYEQPQGLVCSVTNAAGTVATSNISDVVVSCSPN